MAKEKSYDVMSDPMGSDKPETSVHDEHLEQQVRHAEDRIQNLVREGYHGDPIMDPT